MKKDEIGFDLALISKFVTLYPKWQNFLSENFLLMNENIHK
jgi:hypothetical protein